MAATHRDDEEPLDPAAERLRRKLTRLLMVSGGTMVLGFIAVFGAIVYKTSQAGRAAAEPALASAQSPIDAVVVLPAGGKLVSTELQGERALLRVEAPDGATALLLLDLPSGRVVGRYRLEAE